MNEFSIFKRLDGKHFMGSSPAVSAQKISDLRASERIVTCRTKFYGKPKLFKILSRQIVRYKADFISKQLEIKGGKYCNLMRNAIESGMHNAEYKGLSREKMYIKSISIGRGMYLKRRQFKGRGRSGILRRPYANLLIELKEVSLGK